MSAFHLEPFEFNGQTIEFSVLDTEPHSLVFASIVARNTMRDAEIAVDIKRDHGPVADYQRVFDSIVRDSQQIYLFGPAPRTVFYDQARMYEREYPYGPLREMISFASGNRPKAPAEPRNTVSADMASARAKKKKQKTAHKSRIRNRR